ncbi:vacuolar protein sorting family 37 protein [Kocuria palustris]|nr:vacuolar protein sorting family 37 protein [Kocuria palustris]
MGFNPTALLPLPTSITDLPNPQLEELLANPELVKGYVQLSDSFQQYLDQYATTIAADNTKLQQIKQLIEQYDHVGQSIREKLAELQRLNLEFSSLQVIQYQLLVRYSNELLVKKYGDLVESLDRQLRQLVSEASDELDPKFLAEFRQARKQYHLHRERWARCQEDRVLGSIA